MICSNILPLASSHWVGTIVPVTVNIYGFSRVVGGSRRDMGTYTHQLLVRGEPSMCRFMVRTKIKNKGSRSAASAKDSVVLGMMMEANWNTGSPLPSTAVMLDCVTNVSMEEESKVCMTPHVLCDNYHDRFPPHPHLSYSSVCGSTTPSHEIFNSNNKLHQDLDVEVEEKNMKILKLLELHFSFLEMKKTETGNPCCNIMMQPTKCNIDVTPLVVNCKEQDENGAWDIANDLCFGDECGTTSCHGDHEPIDPYDNIFNDNTTTSVPSEILHFEKELAMSDCACQQSSSSILPSCDTGILDSAGKSHVYYPDVAAELVRIFG